jgi:hypothetical protein
VTGQNSLHVLKGIDLDIEAGERSTFGAGFPALFPFERRATRSMKGISV